MHGFTVPAINLRVVTYDAARAIFRTAIAIEAGAFILEIARSEIAYTGQRPHEYVSVILAAALREGFRGPVFIQGDHFQINHKKYAVDPKTEVDAVKTLVHEAVGAGFYNIDIDTSTLVDVSKPSHSEQQRLNYEVGVEAAEGSSRCAAAGVAIDRWWRSAGRHANSTVEELRAYMDGLRRRFLPTWTVSRRSACRAARRTAVSCSRTARSPREARPRYARDC